MAYWEFLLQKEGDRDWLPLETAHVEISEGRYRIIAHSSYCQTDVNICLSRLLAEPLPPQRKTLKRIGATNESGLMVVIPFTHLTPGLWTVTCSAAQDAVEAPWEFGVQLDVLAIESGIEYWDTELDEAALAEQLISPSPPPDAPPWTAPATPPMPTAQQPAPSETPREPWALQTPIADLPLRLQLPHQALVAQTAVPLKLQGQVTTFSQVEGLVGEGTLWVQLRNPETGAVVHQSAQAISISALPSRFDMVMSLPEESTTRLLVGELSLWTASAPPQVLAIQGFTVTLNLDALLELVANQAENSLPTDFEDLTVPLTDSDQTSPLVAASAATTAAGETPSDQEINPLSPRSVPFRLIYLPSSGLTLPPVIYRPIDKKTVGAPTLPRLTNQPRRDRAAITTNADATPETPSAPPAKPLTLPPISPATTSEPTDRPAAAAPSLELPILKNSAPVSDAASAAVSEQAPNDTGKSASNPLNPEAFEPDLQGRFWERLSALAEEAQKAAADYKAQLEAAGVHETTPVAETMGLSEGAAIADPSTRESINYEVVVYDIDDEPAVSGLDETTTASEPLIEVLPPGAPDYQELGEIPVPDWVFPQGELIAGAPLPITVHLPTYPRRLAVKVWVTDIQTRTLVDRPRWLMNWTPTPEGTQTAFLQLQVPMGSIEARFEAITIDLATQRESYKTSIVRHIAPTDLPPSEAEELL
ncbi:MAG: hypothetical protein AAGD09_19690 [Cyanobacteria bacterium P01_F01_bin.56]